MRQRLPYYFIIAGFIIAGHLYAQGIPSAALANAFVVLLLLGIAATAVLEWVVFEQAKHFTSLYDGPVDDDDGDPGPGGEIVEVDDITLVIPACRDAEPVTEVIDVIRPDEVPLLVEQEAQLAVMQEQATLAEIADRYAAAAEEGMRVVDAIASGAPVRELGVA